VLQGDGGDELFGGYGRYFTLANHMCLRPLARVLKRLHALTPKSVFHYRVRRYLHALAAKDLAVTMALLLTPEDRSLAPEKVLAGRVREAIGKTDPFARHRECQQLFRDHDVLNQMSYLDLLITLPDTYLEKVDRATMAASLEVRVPFLDSELVDFVSRLPGRDKMPFGKKKWLLKKALQGIVPAEVLNGRKVGLEVPYGQWLQGALKPLFFDHLSTFSRRYAGVLDVDRVTRLFAWTGEGRCDGSYMLWKVLNLMIWANNSNVNVLG
jgi:asparagine synthase (glutamine-hydrolysing)